MTAGPDILFCGDPLVPGQFDQHYRMEAELVRELGGTVAAIDHDALMRGDPQAAVRRVPRDSGPWWYRGWMVTTVAYENLAQALRGRGVELRVSARRYRTAHELPGWYGTFRAVTPASDWTLWTPGDVPTADLVQALASTLAPGPAIVKDFVKSRKHEWHQACFIPDLTDIESATAVVARMVALQEDDLNGGIVIRQFEDYRRQDGRAVEARVWWHDGKPAMVTAHPDTPHHLPEPDLTGITPLVAALGCPFVTTDLAQRVDGQWRVVEVGDGQVSDLPAGVDPTPLLTRLAEPTTSDAMGRGS